MPLPILTYPDPRLKRVSRELTEITDAHRKLAADMAETMYAAEGIGLAAPQIGEAIRLIVVDVTGPEERKGLQTFINPKITPLPDAGMEECEEGCLSVPDFRSKVRRPAKIHLSALNLAGEPVEMDAEGMLAVCLQHETDHLDGKLFIDRLAED